MDGRMERHTRADRQTDNQAGMDGRTDRETNTDRQTHGLTGKQAGMDGRMERHTRADRQTDKHGQTHRDRQTNRQTGICLIVDHLVASLFDFFLCSLIFVFHFVHLVASLFVYFLCSFVFFSVH